MDVLLWSADCFSVYLFLLHVLITFIYSFGPLKNSKGMFS